MSNSMHCIFQLLDGEKCGSDVKVIKLIISVRPRKTQRAALFSQKTRCPV
jgi:uncharacterized protein (UPF0335 family)